MHPLTETEKTERLAKCPPEHRDALSTALDRIGNIDKRQLDPRTVRAMNEREAAIVRQHHAETETDDRRNVLVNGRIYKLETLDPTAQMDISGGLRARGMRAASRQSVTAYENPRGVEVMTKNAQRAFVKSETVRTHTTRFIDRATGCSAEEIGDYILQLRDEISKLRRAQIAPNDILLLNATIENLRSRQCANAGKTRKVLRNNRGAENRPYRVKSNAPATIHESVANSSTAAPLKSVRKSKTRVRRNTLV